MNSLALESAASSDPIDRDHVPKQQLKPGRRTKTSPVWNFFHIDPQYICRVICSICKKSVSRGQCATQLGTSTMQRHLQAKHPVEWAKARQVEGAADSETLGQQLTFHTSEAPELNTSRLGSPGPPDRGVPPASISDQSPFCTPPSSELSNIPFTSTEQIFHEHLKEESLDERDCLPLKQKRTKESSVKEEMQLEDTICFLNKSKNGDPALGSNNYFDTVQSTPTLAKRTKSLVWKFFNTDPQHPSKAMCLVCSRRVSRGRPGTPLGTSTLQRHLLAKHPEHWSLAHQDSTALDLQCVLRFPLSTVLPVDPCAPPTGIKTLYSTEALQVAISAEKGIERCVNRIHGEQQPWSSENIKPEPVLSHCAVKEEFCVQRPQRIKRHGSNENHSRQVVPLSNYAENQGVHCLSRFHSKSGYRNCKCPKPVPVSSCATVKDESCTESLNIKRRHWPSEHSDSTPTSMISKSEKAGLCVSVQQKEGNQSEKHQKTETCEETDRVSGSLLAALLSHNSSGRNKESFLNHNNHTTHMCRGQRKKRIKSPVWLFFCIVPEFPSRAVCKVCQKSVSRGREGTPLGTSTLQRHLVAKHPAHWDRAIGDGQEVPEHLSKQLEPCTMHSGRICTFKHAGNTQRVVSAASHLSPCAPQKHLEKVVDFSERRLTRQSKMLYSKRLFLPKKLCKKLNPNLVTASNAGPQLGSGVSNPKEIGGADCVLLKPKRTKRITSPVWHFFNKDPECSSHAICVICMRSVSRGKPGTPLGTSTLQRHLLAKHPAQWQAVLLNEEGLGAGM
ncbi:zinc finger BED domain-containing protein 6 [Ambystoma mexicanum]|uniref:zinc finger BED domain-containing protein 6 n=1 Tax=Ambystoma mexicanum TaxID=8296 RepID=UPI0037E74AC3